MPLGILTIELWLGQVVQMKRQGKDTWVLQAIAEHESNAYSGGHSWCVSAGMPPQPVVIT